MPAHTVSSTAAAHLAELLEITDLPKVSILMPLVDPQQDAIRGRGLVARARTMLDERAVDPAEADGLDTALQELLADVHPVSHTKRGIVLYAAPGTRHRVLLTGPVVELVAVGSEFHLLPLIAAADPVHAFLLALARGGHALWRVDRHSTSHIGLHGAPDDLAEVTRFREMEKQLQVHASARGGAMMFHGHQESADREREPIRVYFRGVDEAVRRAIDGDTAPVLLVGPGNLPAIYREVSSIGSLLPEVAETHPEGLGEDAIAAMVRTVLDREVGDRTRQVLERVGALRSSRRSSTIPAEVLIAGRSGRVDTVLFDPDADSASVVNRAVVASLRHGATAHPAPHLASGVAAIYRW